MARMTMQTLVINLFGVSSATALALMSVVVDFRVTQTVNQTRGIHAILPHGALGALE
jgi:acetamidase/formamidase